MRVSGVEFPEQTLIAPWMLPAEICERRRATSFSLSMTARRRNTERSIRIDIVIISRNRIGHIPHPPSWKASANILRTVISGPPCELRDAFDNRGAGANRPSARIRTHTVALVVPDRFAAVSCKFHDWHT